MNEEQQKFMMEMLENYRSATSLPHTPEKAENLRKKIAEILVKLGIPRDEWPAEFKGGYLSGWEDTEGKISQEEINEIFENIETIEAQPPNIPFTISEIRDQLIKDEIPREEWENVIEQLNSKGEANIWLDSIEGAKFSPKMVVSYVLKREAKMYISTKTINLDSLAHTTESPPKSLSKNKLNSYVPCGLIV